uniref:Uncharacterized protein n=1 Tax=Romanomermis culicivorax TaxID=13658 RepID=A0A915HKG6_ROMCU
MITNPDTSMTDFKRVMWIKNKILHAYYQQNLEDKAFNEIFRQQSHMRYILRAILTADGQTNPDEAAENQLNRLRQLSEFFLDTRAFDNLKSFYDLLLVDTQARKYMNYIISDDFAAEKIQETVKSMLEKVGPRSKYFNIHGTVRSLLERSAPVSVDRTCVEYLLGKIRRNSARLEFAMETDVSDEQISERGYHLMLLLASSLPTAFYSEQCLALLLEFLREGNTLADAKIVKLKEMLNLNHFSRNLLPELEKISEIGTEKQAKHAISCINKIWPHNIEAAVRNVDIRNVYVQPAFATLSSIARIRPKEFREKLKSIVSLRVTHTGCTDENENDTTWIEPQHLSIEAKAKVSAVKFLAYRILGMKTNDDNHAINTLKLLNGIIESGGNLQEIRMSYVDKAYMRLTAGCFYLKLMREKMFVDLMPLEHYTNLCYLITDDCSQVRAKFAAKLHKNLYSLRLPLEMMAALCLVPLIKLQDENLLAEKELNSFKTQVRDSILLNYRRRKEYLKKNTSLQSFPWKYLPEYYISFCIYLLAHYSEFESYDDTEILKDLKECMWFSLEPMINRKDADKANAPFLYRIMENVKHARDAVNPDDVATNKIQLLRSLIKSSHFDVSFRENAKEKDNILAKGWEPIQYRQELFNGRILPLKYIKDKKLWAVCDLGMSLIKSRTPNFDSKPLQYKPLLSKRFFAQNKRGQYFNHSEFFNFRSSYNGHQSVADNANISQNNNNDEK